ncbi:CHAT domain-containing protein, partial [Mycena epipterygia]
ELARSTLAEFHQSINISSLESAIGLYAKAISGQDSLGIGNSRMMRQLTNAYLIQFRSTGDTERIDKSVSLLRQLHIVQPNQVSCLCAALLAKSDRTNISDAIRLIQEALKSDNEALELANTGTDSLQVFCQGGDDLKLDMAISALGAASVQLSWGHQKYTFIIGNLGIALHERFTGKGDPADLDVAIGLHCEALDLCPPPHPDHGMSLNNLANVLHLRFQTRGDSGDLDNAIELHHEALDLFPPPHPYHGGSLNNLANGLHERFKGRGDPTDLDVAIGLHCEVLDLHPPPHPDRGMSLDNLAVVLHLRFQTRGDTADLDSAIGLHQEALNLHPAPHPHRGSSLNNLANVLYERFKGRGDPTDLDVAIGLHFEVLDLCPPHPDRGMSLNNLAAVLHERFQARGDAGDLDGAIRLHQEALDLRPPPHPDHGSSLNNWAAMLLVRFQTRGDATDLDHAIELHRKALGLHAAPHPDHAASLNNLANTLRHRFQRRGDAGDLDHATELNQEVLDLRPPPHLDRGVSLNNLSAVLHLRFHTRGDAGDLDSAVRLHQEALELCPAPHPDRGNSLHNLANGLHERFQTSGQLEDLDRAIGMQHEAVTVYESPHPQHGNVLASLARKLFHKYDHSLDFDTMEEGVIAFHESSGYIPSPVSERCNAAANWAQHAEQRSHESALEAYTTAIELLPQQAMLALDIRSRQEALKLTSVRSLASNAAAYACRKNETGKAVEFLEAGRSVFWSQALQLHTSLDDLQSKHPVLAQRISNLSKILEIGSHRNAASIRMLPPVHKDHMMLDKDDAHYRKLNAEWIEALDEVRQQPGFQRFLRPKLMNELRAAAIHGPIAILNASKSGCTAFIVTLSGEVQALHLANMTWDRAQLLVDLLRALLSHSSVQIIQTLTKMSPREASTEFPPLQERLDGRVEHSKHLDPNKVFGWLLAEIWALIVQPVFHALELKKCDNPSRLWWCPTGPLTFLPIHAAGLYAKPGTDCVSNYVVSSYTPTLASLLDQPTQIPSVFKMTAVIQPTTDDCPNLPDTVEELARIRQQVPAEWLTALGDASPATVDNALQHLRESSVVHFACHGTQDLKNPLETGLHLPDGRLEVSELMQGKSQKKTMSLAFLSACETAKGDETVPDEAMHLAATLLFAGFRGVVATMWTMADPDGPRIAEAFYAHLFRGCDHNAESPILPDLTKAAEALHIAVAKLRADPNVPFSRWVPFVHYGL